MKEDSGRRHRARPSYDAAFRRAYNRTFERLECIETERATASDQVAELLALSPLERAKTLRSEPRFRSYSLAARLLARSQQEILRDPIAARGLTRFAQSVIETIDPRTCGGAEALSDLRAYALASEGNSLRVRGDLRAALKAFSSARASLQRGGIDLDLAAMIDHMESSLRRDLWQLDSALSLLDRATEAFLSLDERENVAQALLKRATIYVVKRDWSKAIASLRTALEWTVDPTITLWARHNLADALVKAGCARQAAQVLSLTRDLYDRFGDELTTNRRLWVEGLIARELGEDLQHASDLLELATENFLVHGYACDAALARLDLVVTRRKQATRRRTRRREAPTPLREALPCQRSTDPLDPFHPRVASAQ